jgi:FtsP/CotA-like multicopper oxidase with cupredoxin domain
VDASGARRHLRLPVSGLQCARAWTRVCVLALASGCSAAAASGGTPAAGRTLDYWVAAVPVSWNIVPNGRDAIGGEAIPPADSIISTVIYRRYSPGWRRPEPNATRSSADGLLIPGPLLKARVGDRLRIHFKNMDTLRNEPHSMHFHGVHYEPSSDGSYVPGFSGPDGDVKPGHSYTYRLTAGEDSAGVWPYHDHSPSMMESIAGGMYGMLSILGRGEQPPDREFEVVLAPMGKFMAIDGRAFVGNTPVFRAKVGELVQWDVMALGSDFHTFHVHGHRWLGPDDVPRDTQTVGPAESYRFRFREDAPGTWLYHCHVEDHMMRGMIGIYQVTK